MVCVGQLAKACDAGQMSEPGDGMILAEGINFWVSSNKQSLFRLIYLQGGASARAEQLSRCKVLDKSQCAKGSNIPSHNVTLSGERDLMDNPFMLPPNVDLGKVFAYQFMKRRLELYHATRRNNIKKQSCKYQCTS